MNAVCACAHVCPPPAAAASADIVAALAAVAGATGDVSDAAGALGALHHSPDRVREQMEAIVAQHNAEVRLRPRLPRAKWQAKIR